MAEHAVTHLRLTLSCDPAEPLLVIGYQIEWRRPFEPTFTVVRDRAFIEPSNFGELGDLIAVALLRELGSIPRMLPFE